MKEREVGVSVFSIIMLSCYTPLGPGTGGPPHYNFTNLATFTGRKRACKYHIPRQDKENIYTNTKSGQQTLLMRT